MKSLAHTTSPIRLPDGALTQVTQWGTRGPALVCVHGMTSSRFSWMRFAAKFADDFRIFAYDQRGHGDSAHIQGPMSLDQADADLRAVCEAVDGPIASLVGHSWGGSVVVRGGTTTRTQRVVAIDPVILVAPDFDWYGEYVLDFDEDLKLPPQQREIELRTRYHAMGWAPDDIEGKLHAVAKMTREPLIRLAAENAVDQGGWDLRELVHHYPKPLLLCLANANDSTVTAHERAWLHEHAGPRTTQIVYEDHGHNLHRTDFDRFAADVERWFET
ncbi:MAG: alpha/beta hydrolase [Candidatus Eremiobacteraeota bacterium]|nr:alpha/beta hydrolase [Candidatus Eremiobacteraeota bacterium]